MLYIRHDHTDAYFNAAAEQYLLHETDEDILMLWRNENAVVMGKHQVAYKEVNYPYVTEHNVQVVRRITGGGTVYHDLGNINFTFIEKIADREKMVDFKRYLVPMQKALSELGVKVEITLTNDLTLNGKKISGNAAHVFSQQKKIIHHGTILFNSDLTTLGNAIRQGEGEFETKGVNSNRTTVTSIQENGHSEVDIQAFMDDLGAALLKASGSYENFSFSPNDVRKIQELRDSKFTSWEWNYGYSPVYTRIRKNFLRDGDQLSLKVKNGEILEARYTHLNMELDLPILQGQQHRYEALESIQEHLSQALNWGDGKIEMMRFFD